MGNTVLIVGNGFDLYHKLPTRYTDFLTFVEAWELFLEGYNRELHKGEENPEKNEASNYAFEITLDDYGRLNKDSLVDFSKYAKYIDEKSIKYLQDNLRENAWIKYFLETNYKQEGWIDFEREMEKVLVEVDKHYEHDFRTYIGKVPNVQMTNKIALILSLFGRKAKPPYKDYGAMMVRQEDILPENIRQQKVALIGAMKDEMDVLIRCLHIYLWEFVCRIACNWYSEQIKELNDIYLLNFNYTYSYKSVYGDRKRIEHHPIHGSLLSEELVLGISDNALNNLDYVYFQKYFQRIQKRSGSYYKKWIDSQVNEEGQTEPTRVYIMGHSLDKTDKGILEEFFKSESIKKIYIYYHNQGAYEAQVINLIEMFGKEFVIEQVGNERIEFIKLKEAVYGVAR